MTRYAKRLVIFSTAVVLVLVPLPSSAGPALCTVTGTDGDDVFTETMQTPGSDVVCGLGGDDTFFWSAGDDLYLGGDGRDLVSYAQAPLPCEGCFGISANLYNDYVFLELERDDIPEIEDIEASPWRDQIEDHPSEPNLILGRGSADDVIFAGEGDRILGNGGPDTIRWRFTGDIALPLFISGNHGKDRIATYSSQQGVTVDLEAGTIDGPEVHAELVSIEHAQGTRYADTLIGDEKSNNLRGGVGDDALFGRAGNDTLIGGTQIDTADGQDGTDSCDAETESNCEA
ncbi:MAG: calcium-binding protein [Actinomycetota bacterium]